MARRTRLALLAAASAAVACSSSPASRPLAPEGALAARGEPFRSTERAGVDPAFREHVAELSRQVRYLEAFEGAAADMAIRRALLTLAAALDSVPFARDRVDDIAAETIVGSEARMAIGMPSEAAYLRTAHTALASASGLLLHLARGPYREAPRVLGRAVLLRSAVDELGETTGLAEGRPRIVQALRLADRVLVAMVEALERGDVPRPGAP